MSKPENHKDHDHAECRKLLSALSEYVDGTLEEEVCAIIEEHMAGCENCRVVVDTLQKTIYLYHSTAEQAPPVPEDVRDRLYKRLHIEDFLK